MPNGGVPGAGPELVVLLDAEGRPCGQMAKARVHHRHTPLHLAFSCWVQGLDGRWLVTRRAAVKPTWPLAWTNAVCGHPAPGEDLAAAVRRRAADELGLVIEPADVQVVLPDFRYRAEMPSGVVENEVCPVFHAVLSTAQEPRPDPAEVAEWRWTSMAELRADVEVDATPWSPWMLGQLEQLTIRRLV